jgi:hypothetical protein
MLNRFILLSLFSILFLFSCQSSEKGPSKAEQQFEKEILENAIDSVPDSVIIKLPSDSL